MSNYKVNIDDPSLKVETYARVFKALSNPHRLRILMELTRCPVTGGVFSTNVEKIKNCQQDFAQKLGLAPSTVSHHFKELRQAGLLNMTRKGKIVTVQVDFEMLAALRALF